MTGVVVEDGRMLVLDQDTDPGRPVSLPGGAVEYVPFGDLVARGFSERFADLVVAGFPDAGRYAGPKAAIGL
ncbi:MAG: hypothetical protein KY460_12755 [Actinobacteria bacterium]|nr:hypothetical protein [Actinomycetota bacterium]